jgi:hypothetical protein
MAKMNRLDPAPKQPLPCEGWELIATEAIRSPMGLKATILLCNGSPQASKQLVLADSESWGDFLHEVAGHIERAPEEIRPTVLKLVDGVEGIMRQMEAQHESRGTSQATELVELAGTAELFHDPSGEAYATIDVDKHRETWLLKAKGFRSWIRQQYYLAHDKTPGSQAVQDALGVLEGKALFEGPEAPVYTRLAEHEGTIYLDLGDEDWHVVRITPLGWDVITAPPVKFRRSRGLLPLPMPERGGELDDLQGFVNVSTDQDHDWHLLVSWLLATFRPSGPFPVLTLHGEQGSAKSCTSKVLRLLVDPNATPLRASPRDLRDLAITANNSWVLTLDNLSHLPDWLSDAICRLATGGGFATRELHTDLDEVLFEAQRPVILNGIEEIATRADLLDRAILLYLPNISKTERKPEKQFWADFEAQRPQLLGALLTAVSGILAQVDAVEVDELPRMADFSLWATAAEQALGWEKGSFAQAYTENCATANQVSLDASLLVTPLEKLAPIDPPWTGTATQLLTALDGYVDDATKRQRHWPKSPKALSDNLRRLAPNLRAHGIEVVFLSRTMTSRGISVRKYPKESS